MSFPCGGRLGLPSSKPIRKDPLMAQLASRFNGLFDDVSLTPTGWNRTEEKDDSTHSKRKSKHKLELRCTY
ncbi:hypothetical protein TNCT_672351 [Trichonephila clavata]|uniref:Uncharacterized protein n=1 Tax=Trichonephila clavata TaxID=2740835 RepID=A0A8X6EY96_TRICU|nr:hypothetical protein TNCT_672351 [Trichonephila clavata]